VDDLLGSFRWYDALCIHQSDNQERSEQVRTMRQIYSMAEEVVAYVSDNSVCEDDLKFLKNLKGLSSLSDGVIRRQQHKVTGLQGMAVKSRHLGCYPSYSRLGAL
jgi:hypothetical protein